MKITIRDPNGKILSFENTNSTEYVNDHISMTQLISLLDIFSDRIYNKQSYTETDLAEFENEFGFKFDKGTYDYFFRIGSFSIGKFEVPNVYKNIQYTNEWLANVATDEEKDKFVVVESDNGDYTLVDRFGTIYVYSKEKDETINLNEDITTHLGKHLMEQIIGEEKY